jgi:hypothetical protein
MNPRRTIPVPLVLSLSKDRAQRPKAARQVFELRQFIFYTTQDGKIVQTECTMLPPEESVVEVAA